MVFRSKGGCLELLQNLLALEFLLRKKGFLRNGGTRRPLVPKSVGAGPLWAYFQAQIYKYPMIYWRVGYCWSFETNLWNQKFTFVKVDFRTILISLAKFNCFFDGTSIGILEELWSHLQLLGHTHFNFSSPNFADEYDIQEFHLEFPEKQLNSAIVWIGY